MTRYQNPNISLALPDLDVARIASRVQPVYNDLQDALVKKFKTQWRTSQPFRDSFKRKDARDVAYDHMDKWHTQLLKDARKNTPALT